MLRKDRVLDALQSLCTQPAQQNAWRQRMGFSAEEVAEVASVDRTNASRDLNQLVQEGRIERIPGRPVLFLLKTSSQQQQTEDNEAREKRHSADKEIPHQQAVREPVSTSAREVSSRIGSVSGKPPVVATSGQVGTVASSFETLIGSEDGLKVAIQQAKAAMLYPQIGRASCRERV